MTVKHLYTNNCLEGQDKVKEAVAQYQLFFKTENFDSKQFFKTETL